MRLLVLLLASTFFGGLTALAQQSVGKAMIDGKMVILYNDGTWSFQDEKPNCTIISKGISFCGRNQGWKRDITTTPGIDATFTLDDRHYGMIINELLGTNDGMSPEFMTTAVIGNASTGAGVPISDVVQMGFEDGTELGFQARTVTYGVPIDGVDFVFLNTILFSESRTTQLITYSIGVTVSDTHASHHETYLSSFSIE